MTIFFVKHRIIAVILIVFISQTMRLDTGQCGNGFEGEWFIISNVGIPNKDGWYYCGDYIDASDIKQEYNKVEKIIIKIINNKYNIAFDKMLKKDSQQAANKIDKVFNIKKMDEWLTFRRITYTDDDNGVASLFSMRLESPNRLEGWWQKGTTVNVLCLGHKPSGDLTGFKNFAPTKMTLH